MTDPSRRWIRLWQGPRNRVAYAVRHGAKSLLRASTAKVRPGLLVVLLIALAPLYIIAIQPELHASGDTIDANDSPGSLPFSVVNVTPCVTTSEGADLNCSVSYTAGNSLVLSVSLDTGSLEFDTPSP